ncbi:MAG: DNA primase [Phycisphaerae bacterium]|nr:DNA primase [Phycisphaerae bacterium]
MDRQGAEAVTRQIQDSVDIVDYISSYVALKKRGREFVGLCPFHQEKTPSFSVSPSKRIFKCFGCGAGGDIFTFVQLREKVSFLEARQLLAERAGIPLDTVGNAGGKHGPDRSSLFQVNQWAHEQFRTWFKDPELGKTARSYVEGRKLDPAVVESFGLGFAPSSWDALQQAAAKMGIATDHLAGAGLVRPRNSGSGYRDTFYNRLMFPIRDPGGRFIGFGGRTLGEDRAKYLNTPETPVFDKGRNLYGLADARDAISERGRAIVVEGYTDCMVAHQFGFPETVATLGTAMTADHVRLLKRFTDNAYLVFDSDEAGSRAAERGLEVFLTQQLDVKLVQVPQGKDPCDFLLAQGGEAFETLLKNAASALEFSWRAVRQRFGGAESGPGRREAVEKFLNLLATSAVFGAVDAIQRGLVVNHLSKLLSIQPEELHRELARVGRRVSARGPESGQGEDQAAPVRGTRSRSRDTEQLAICEIIEVVINEPGFFDRVEGYLQVDRLEDPDLRAVASAVIEMAREFGEFSVSELIARLEEPRYARLVTDMQQAGEAKQNYEVTLEMACRRIDESRRESEFAEAAARLRDGAEGMSQADQDSLLESVAAQAKERSGPLPLRMSRRRR